MSTHTWGDKDFNWEQFREACEQIQDIYHELTGNNICWKEKWGTLRFEYISVPVDSEKNDGCPYKLEYVPTAVDDFLFSVLLTVADYPQFASEILDDFLFHDKWDKINQYRKQNVLPSAENCPEIPDSSKIAPLNAIDEEMIRKFYDIITRQ